MASPDRPRFDISDQTLEAIMLRVDQARGTPLVSYVRPVMQRMEHGHKRLFRLTESVFKTAKRETAFATGFGAALAYDAISTQLESEGKTIEINNMDITQMQLDMLHHGQAPYLRDLSVFKTVSTLVGLRRSWSKYDKDVMWLSELAREQTPMLFSLIQYFILKGGDASVEEQGAVLRGAFPIMAVFYRRLGLIGQPQDPHAES